MTRRRKPDTGRYFALTPSPGPVDARPAPAAPWPAERPGPRLAPEARAIVGRIAAAHPDADLLHRWPSTLLSLVRIAEAALREHRDADPLTAAHAIVAAQCQFMGGDRLRWPDAGEIERILLDHRLWREFDGRNARELAARYDKPLRTVYHILRQQRLLEQARRRAPDAG